MKARKCKRCARIDAEVARLRDKIVAAANSQVQSDQYELVAEVIRLTLDALGLEKRGEGRGQKSEVGGPQAATAAAQAPALQPTAYSHPQTANSQQPTA